MGTHPVESASSLENPWLEMHIITLATSFNRSDLTLRSIKSLSEQQLDPSITLTHYLVDDCSSDNTPGLVDQQFPSVNILKGTGQLYWAGGMRHGWSSVISGSAFDYLFVYNDDCQFSCSCISNLLATAESFASQSNRPFLVSGSLKSFGTEAPTYGGQRRSGGFHPLRFKLVEPFPDSWQKVDTVNMNACLIPAKTLRRIGFLEAYFIHSGADYEYGLRLVRLGGFCLLAPGYVGYCNYNPRFNYSSYTFKKRLKLLFSAKGQPISQRFHFYRSYGGLLWPILFLLPYIRILLIEPLLGRKFS